LKTGFFPNEKRLRLLESFLAFSGRAQVGMNIAALSFCNFAYSGILLSSSNFHILDNCWVGISKVKVVRTVKEDLEEAFFFFFVFMSR
jgi:hypothetical protein